ncbi:MAG: glutamate-5-semialdehyde dehydrogenase [Aphanocapsa sp. GSE-SYN-MK-11-07L]|jgi:glutamate-5-semialdehyde dehydrogenase|nr:glutamate-5-semialdehyde dehydrogenase [Aphanocapsa sp. GSE-SYN-MK-11-07L]
MTLEPLPIDLTTSLYQANAAAAKLARSRTLQRNAALQAILNLLKDKQNEILEANTLDLETSREMAASEVVLGWLKLTPEQLQTTTRLLQQLIALPDPLERMISSAYRTEQSQTYTQLAPLGVVAFVYEAFPVLAIIAAAMCIKTANSIVLKGSSEGSQSNQVIADLLQTGVERAGLPTGCVQALASDGSILVRDLIAQEQDIDLVIPYGRPNLVQQVVRQSAVPVLKSVRGNCYLFWSATGSAEVAKSMIIDSHQGDPDPVNAIEKVLLHANLNRSLLVVLFNSLKAKGFGLRAEAELAAEFPELQVASETEWKQPYLKKIVAFRKVPGLEAAIAWINTHSSCHADCIVTESYQESRAFIREVDSASTYINASPRFYRSIGNLPGGISLGMSNQKGYSRGVIGLTALMTTKSVIQGEETVKNE